jgi:hypothetical protein
MLSQNIWSFDRWLLLVDGFVMQKAQQQTFYIFDNYKNTHFNIYIFT